MNIPIIFTASYALSLLQKTTSFQVHSVYRKTINLSSGSTLLSLQASGSPVSPLSLITSLSQAELEALDAKPGASVLTGPDCLVLSGSGAEAVFLLSDAQIVNSLLRPGLPANASCLIREVLSSADTTGFRVLFSELDAGPAPSGQFLINEAARRLLDQCTASIRTEDWETAAGFLARLTGLGIGLTPSGDDFLCGVLAGLILSSMTGHPFSTALNRAVCSHLDQTNDISRAFLSCSLLGQFSQAVCSLAFPRPASEILASFQAIGHSSGTDTLCGIYYILTSFPKEPTA